MTKLIINGLIYNTETAEKVATGEANEMSEELYRTKKGAYFLYDSNCSILPIDVDALTIGWDDEHQYGNSFYDWLENWNVDLETREIEIFKIKDA